MRPLLIQRWPRDIRRWRSGNVPSGSVHLEAPSGFEPENAGVADGRRHRSRSAGLGRISRFGSEPTCCDSHDERETHERHDVSGTRQGQTGTRRSCQAGFARPPHHGEFYSDRNDRRTAGSARYPATVTTATPSGRATAASSPSRANTWPTWRSGSSRFPLRASNPPARSPRSVQLPDPCEETRTSGRA